MKIEYSGKFYPYCDLICQLIANMINKNSNKIIEIQIISKKQIKKINFKLRNKNIITDVLSISGENYLLGTILICDQALKISFYETLIHGVLHLFGYTHKIDSEFKIMQNLEKEIYKKFLEYKLLNSCK